MMYNLSQKKRKLCIEPINGVDFTFSWRDSENQQYQNTNLASQAFIVNDNFKV